MQVVRLGALLANLLDRFHAGLHRNYVALLKDLNLFLCEDDLLLGRLYFGSGRELVDSLSGSLVVILHARLGCLSL